MGNLGSFERRPDRNGLVSYLDSCLSSLAMSTKKEKAHLDWSSVFTSLSLSAAHVLIATTLFAIVLGGMRAGSGIEYCRASDEADFVYTLPVVVGNNTVLQTVTVPFNDSSLVDAREAGVLQSQFSLWMSTVVGTAGAYFLWAAMRTHYVMPHKLYAGHFWHQLLGFVFGLVASFAGFFVGYIVVGALFSPCALYVSIPRPWIHLRGRSGDSIETFVVFILEFSHGIVAALLSFYSVQYNKPVHLNDRLHWLVQFRTMLGFGFIALILALITGASLSPMNYIGSSVASIALHEGKHPKNYLGLINEFGNTGLAFAYVASGVAVQGVLFWVENHYSVKGLKGSFY